MPILECILIDATANQIKFTTNDMELGIETIVVLEGTAFNEMLTLFNRFVLEQMIFIMCITSFLEKMGFLLNIFKKISAVSAVGGVNM